MWFLWTQKNHFFSPFKWLFCADDRIFNVGSLINCTKMLLLMWKLFIKFFDWIFFFFGRLNCVLKFFNYSVIWAFFIDSGKEAVWTIEWLDLEESKNQVCCLIGCFKWLRKHFASSSGWDMKSEKNLKINYKLS